jgi:hypothetical protein
MGCPASAYIESDDRAKQACRQKDQSCDQLERAANGDPDQAKRQQQQPYKRVYQSCQQGQRPAKNQKQAPEEKLSPKFQIVLGSMVLIR